MYMIIIVKSYKTSLKTIFFTQNLHFNFNKNLTKLYEIIWLIIM